MIYGYDDLLHDLKNFNNVFSIGKSVYGRDIFAVILGAGNPQNIIHAGIHARESVSSAALVAAMKNYDGDAICFVPMVNPDGVELVKNGISSAPPEYRNALIKINGGNDFSMWKANGRAVDLNVNFDAKWGSGLQNVQKPSSANYIGIRPNSELETIALVNLCEKYKFLSSISLHTKGEIVYYGFNNCLSRIKYVKMIADVFGYGYQRSVGSAGGFKDWFVQSGGFGVTVELLSDGLSHPIAAEYAELVSNQISDAAYTLAAISEELWKNGL